MSATNKKDEWREVCVERKSLCGFAGFSQMRERVGICSIIGEELQRCDPAQEVSQVHTATSQGRFRTAAEPLQMTTVRGKLKVLGEGRKALP